MGWHRLTPEFLRECEAKGMARAAIAAAAGVTPQAVCKALQRMRAPVPRTARRRTFEIPAEKRSAVWRLAAEGLPCAAIARALGVSYSWVWCFAKANGIKLAPGPVGRPGKGTPPRPQPPTLRDLLDRLTPAQRADYDILRRKGGYSVAEALRAIRRDDLIARITDKRLAA